MGSSAPQRFELSGKVTYKGKPVLFGRINFTPDDAHANTGSAGGAEIKDGAYKTGPGQGAIGGPHVVVITAFDGQKPDGPDAAMFPHGKPLPRLRATVDLPRKPATMDFEIPDK